MSTKLESKETSGQPNQLGMVSERSIASLSNLMDVPMDDPQPSSCDESLEKVQRLPELPYGMPKDSQFVRCQICGTDRKRLSHHFRSVHGMNSKEYQVLFPDAPISAQDQFNALQKGHMSFLDSLSDEEKQHLLDNANKAIDSEVASRRAKTSWSRHHDVLAKAIADGIHRVMEEEPERREEWNGNVGVAVSKAIQKIKREDPERYARTYGENGNRLQAWIKALTEQMYADFVANRNECILKVWQNYTEEEYQARLASFSYKPVVFDYEGTHYEVCSLPEMWLILHMVDNDIEFAYEKKHFWMEDLGKRYVSDFWLPQYNVVLESKSSYYFEQDFQKIVSGGRVVLARGHKFLLLIDSLYTDDFQLKGILGNLGTSDLVVLPEEYFKEELHDIVRACERSQGGEE